MIQRVFEIIRFMKNSNSTGYEAILSFILKKIPRISAAVITHLAYRIISSDRYPNCFKLAKIIPILKPSKILTELALYGPVANHLTIHKVIEMVIKEQLETCFEENHLFLDTNHGGRRYHSTRVP